MRGTWAVLVGIALGLLALALPGQAGGPEVEAGWQPVTKGLEYRAVPLGWGSFPAMHQVRLDLAHFRLRLALASDLGARVHTVGALRQKAGALVAVNASYFNPEGPPLGYLREEERLVVRSIATGSAFTGVLLVHPEGARILHRDDFQPGRALLALQAGPRLVAGGCPVQGLSGPARRRTGVATDRQGRVILFATDPGGNLTLQACRDLLGRPPRQGGIQPREALNLDGGSSTGFSLAAGQMHLERPAYTLVPVVLAAVRR